MISARRALHLRSGESGASERIDAWLGDYGLDVVHCAHAYEACVFVLKQGERVPDLVIVGTDWLASDELPILEYFRETWPGAAILVYGSRSAEIEPETPSMSACCPTLEALDDVLSETPAEFVRQMRSRCAEVVEADAEEIVPTRPPADPDAPPRREPQEHDADDAYEPQRAPQHQRQARREPKSMLSDEEWSALLDDDDI